MHKGPIDMHVHLVGNGRSGSGCWLRLNFYRRVLGEAMLRAIGFRGDLNDQDFDERYAAFLLQAVRLSSLTHLVLLAYDEVYAEDGRKLNFGTFHVSNSWVLELARRHAEFLPAVSIHPARKDALHELDRCLEGGAVMLKILPPSQNIDCSLPRYREFFQKMAQANLPLLSHTGGEYTVPVMNKKLCDPRYLRQPLECGVKVIAAHVATRSGPPFLEKDYLPEFVKMLAEFPHLYGDNSALNTPNRCHGLTTCLRPEIMPRIVHGSDFPVPVSGVWACRKKLITKAQCLEAHGAANLIERDYRLKKAMGFDDEVFTRIWKILRI